MTQNSKRNRAVALLAAGVLSVLVLFLIFPPSTSVLACSGFGGEVTPAPGYQMNLNLDSFYPSAVPLTLGSYCLAPGGSVTITNTGSAPLRVEVVSGVDAGNGSAFGGTNMSGIIYAVGGYTHYLGGYPQFAQPNLFALAPGQSSAVRFPNSGFILFVSQSNMCTVINAAAPYPCVDTQVYSTAIAEFVVPQPVSSQVIF